MFISSDIEFKVSNLEYSKIPTLPPSFDWSTIVKDDAPNIAAIKRLITKPPSQYKCGSCWAISVVNCINDAFAVCGLVNYNPKLSTTYALVKYPQGQCKGGSPLKLLKDIQSSGISTKKCINYEWCSKNALCNGSSSNHWNADVNDLIPTDVECDDYFYIKDIKRLVSKGSDVLKVQESIKYHILTYGPVVAGFLVFKNFEDGSFTKNKDTKGIYFEGSNTFDDNLLGGHAVSVIGWGYEDKVLVSNTFVDNIPYWKCRNSWGNKWGDNGYFKIAMYPYNKKSQFVREVYTKDKKLGGVLTFKPSLYVLSGSNLIIYITLMLGIIFCLIP